MITIRRQHVIEHRLNFANRSVFLDVIAPHTDYADVLNRVAFVANKSINGRGIVAIVNAFTHRVVKLLLTAQAGLWRVPTKKFNDLRVVGQAPFLRASHGALCQKSHSLRWLTEILGDVPFVVVLAGVGVSVGLLTSLNCVKVLQSVFATPGVQPLAVSFTKAAILFANQFSVLLAILLVVGDCFFFRSKGHSFSFGVVHLATNRKLIIKNLFLSLRGVDAITKRANHNNILARRFSLGYR